MLVTVLLLLQKLTEFVRSQVTNHVHESSYIDLIQGSISNSSLTDSMVIYLNCNAVQTVNVRTSSTRQKFRNNRLNLMKNMECKEDGTTDILNAMKMGLKGNLTSPDCNSNNLAIPKENLLFCSTDSMHECPDFLQDNSDYQWFLDYGYKDNNYSHHQSILSLGRSQDLVYYDRMARNLDANLAEVDMEDFNREDIHSILSTLPNVPGVEEREMFASVSGSIMVKFGFDECMSPQTSSQEEQNNSASMCKSQPLFSPVHESYMPNTNLSVDSLDLSENDINLMVTCQANKHNYTIAFEGSTVGGVEDSESRETGTSRGSDVQSTSDENEGSCSGDEFHKNRNQCIQNFAQESKNIMTCSNSPFTTWSKIKKNSNENLQLRRNAGGNNNNHTALDDTSNSCNEVNNAQTVKSLSLPNLFRENQKQFSGLSMSVKLDSNCGPLEGEQNCIKLYDIQNSCNFRSVDHSTLSGSGKPTHNFSLLKLYIKQKSGSHEGMANYTKDDTCKDSERNNQITTKDSRMNEINKMKANQSSMSIIGENTKTKNSSHCKCDLGNSICEGQTNRILTEKMEEKKFKSSKTQIKDDYDSGHENKYCSDESTQENGSNTESAENLMCNCAKVQSNKDLKKIVTEKSIQTSKLIASNDNSQKSRLRVPVYILYPNYSLPDLEFLKKKHYVQNIDFSKVFVRPQKFQTTASQASTPKAGAKRPFSVNDIETLKRTGFKHIKDWESLTFLLPKEYKQFLQEIPEIVSQLKEVKNVKEELVPLFCLSPPPNRKLAKRPISCDSNFFNNDYRSSNYSSTATQPSSGYRGSSTMLTSNNSSNTSSPRTPFAHKNESSADSASWQKSGSHKRQYTRNLSEVPPVRPPLPRGILRNNSLDSQPYTCKTQKENANKRYSMIELTDRKPNVDDKLTKRRSGSNFTSNATRNDKVNCETSSKREGKSSRTIDSKDNDCYFEEPSKIQNDLRRLEELLEISAAFGENVESFTENDMLKLRSQVSRFLTMHKNLEKVSETLQTVDENGRSEHYGVESSNKYERNQTLDVKSLHTPHNTPEHKKQVKGAHEKDLNVMGTPKASEALCHSFTDDVEENYLNDETLNGLKKTVSFAEIISIAEEEFLSEGAHESSSGTGQKQQPNKAKCRKGITLAISEESLESSLAESLTKSPLYTSTELLHKRELVLDVKNAIEKILKLSQENEEDPTNYCLHHLCPSLYAILSDGLKEEVDTPFGPIRNSVWSVIEGSSQSGPMTQTLNELVQRLNRDDVFTEGLIKFNAFIFGLINARALSGWFSYLRTRDSLLRKYYDSSGLLVMSNTGGAPIRILVDQLINVLEPLSLVRFNLDLLYQTKLLHCSLQNINHLLEEADNSAFLTPTKQFMLLKLVQSIQNSITRSGEGKKSKQLLEDLDSETCDPPVANLLEGNKEIRIRRSNNKIRPRSVCDILGQDKEVTDVTLAMQKRWSGVHTNSKLIEAFEKLGNDSESDYTDSLDMSKSQKERSSSKPVSAKGFAPSSKTTDIHFEHNTKEQKKNILLNLNKKSGKTDSKTELGLGETSGDATSPLQNGGHKFKRLQQKWEKLSGRTDSGRETKTHSSEREFKQRPNTAPDKSQTSEKFNCDINAYNLPSPTSRISKIPRLVTSPSSTTPSIKASKKVVSPTSLNSATGNQKTGRLVASSKVHVSEGKVVQVPGRLSRCDEKSEDRLAATVGKGHVQRPTSLPYRGSNTMPATKTEAIARRASSTSVNRKTTPKKLQPVQRTVRTLTHRLPSDSGHLSFNEGEKLKVVLEVDKAWLLCCRGTQKGLVPKSAVISDLEGSKF